MARRFTIELLMNLAKSIGANPNKFMGTKTNITFLGKGPTKNPLFQVPLEGIDQASMKQLGPGMIPAVEDAMAYATAGKLNSIQMEILGKNILGVKNVMHPPVLPSASVTDIAPGIEGLRRFPKETHKFMGRPLKDKDFSEIDRMVMEGKIPDARGRTWNLSKARNEKFLKDMGDDLQKSRLQETGPERYNRLTGLDKSRPFQGWTPKVVQETGPKKIPLFKRPAMQEALVHFQSMGTLGEKGVPSFDNLLAMNMQYSNKQIFEVLKKYGWKPKIVPKAEGGLARILEL